MINFNHDSKYMTEAFNLTKQDRNDIDNMMNSIKNRFYKASWFLQRIWLDENLSDNAKCYLIYTLGKFEHFMGDTNDQI